MYLDEMWDVLSANVKVGVFVPMDNCSVSGFNKVTRMELPRVYGVLLVSLLCVVCQGDEMWGLVLCNE